MTFQPSLFKFTPSALVGFLFVLLLSACGGDTSEKPSQPTTEETETPEPANEVPQPYDMTSLKTNEKVYAWVDRLNIRDAANTSGKRVAAATEQDVLEFTGKKTEKTETIVLRGVAYNEPWLKVRTNDGKEGWVFGGAVKREGEEKGNDPISDGQFFFPHFGRFDLSTWEKTSSVDKSGGDAETDVSTYTKGGRILEIEKTDVGEYGYTRRYKLMESSGKVLKARAFAFEGNGLNELKETVNIYTSNPPKKYVRTQKLDKHYMQLGSRPVMVNGTWVEEKADVAVTGAVIGTVTGLCPNVDADSGCECNFQTGEKYVFRSDYKNGCLHINGNIESVVAEIFEDERTKLINQSQSEYWIILNENGDDTMFGEKLEMADKYDAHRAELVQALLVMDEMPTEIKSQTNGTVGMGYRGEVKSMCNEAIQMAKAAKKRGEKGPPSVLRFQNPNYTIYFTVQSIGTDDGGGNDYKGTMEVMSKSGKVLGSKQVTGYCGC